MNDIAIECKLREFTIEEYHRLAKRRNGRRPSFAPAR
jgi:hypothetical protein